MKRWMTIVFTGWLVLGTTGWLPVSAQSISENTEDLFNQGLILYRNQQYEEAKLKFLLLVADPSHRSQLTASTFMLAKTLDKLGQWGDAEQYATTLLTHYPDSRYRPDAHYLQAQLNRKQRDYIEALDHVLWVLENPDRTKLTDRSIELANRILAMGISPSDLEQLEDRHSTPRTRQLLLLWRALAHYGRGQKQQGDQLVSRLLKMNPEPRIARAAEKVNEIPVESLSYPVRIGVILPLTGYFASEAKDFLRGLAFALHEREKSIPEIQIVLKDSRGRAVDAVRSSLELSQEPIAIIVGELEGSPSAALAGIATKSSVPALIPVSSDNGIASIGDQIFQANCDLETRGQEMAKFALQTLDMQTFATLAPADEYGYAMTDAFTSMIDELGGRIISQQWYYPGTQDLQRQFMTIRESGFRYTFRDSLEAAGLSITTGRIDSVFAALNRNTIEESEDDEGLLETTDIPVTSIDGFFFPIYQEDISIIAPQLALYNIQARALGGRYWSDAETLRRHRSYVNNTVFISAYYLSEIDRDYQQFKNSFRTVTGKSPGMMAVYGYNTMNLLIHAVDSGEREPEAIVRHLNSIEELPVLGGAVSFSRGERVNQSFNILEFRDGNIIRLFPPEDQIETEQE